MIEKMPDFYQKREDYRKELREILPVEKQLEYPAEKPEKKLGVPTKELLKLRSSQEPEDRFFIESLRAGIREKLGKDISQEIVQLESLKQFKEEKLCNIAESVDNYASAKEAMERCFKKGWLDSAGKIAIALKDYASAKEAMERCFKKGWPDSAGKIAIALKDYASAKEAMERCFNEERLGSAGEIAIALKDYASAKEAMERSFNGGWLDSAGKIAVSLAEKDPASAKEAMERCFKKKRPDLAGEIAIALKDYASAKEAMERCFNEERLDSAGEIAIALKDYASAKEAMERSFKKGWPDSAGKIAVALAEKDPASAKKAMEQCFNKGWPNPAGKIAVALAEKDPASAKKAMEQCFKKGWLDSAGKIAIALKDYASAKKAMERCFNEERPRPDSAGKIAVALAGQINFNQISHFQNIFVKHQISLQESIFAYIRLARLLREKSDLGKIILEDIPAFRAIKEYSLQMNQLLSEDKQTKDVEEFWTKNQIRLAKFFNINSELSQNLVNVKLNQFGFSRLEKTLELADGLSLDSEVKIKSLIEKTENANTGYFEKLLELSDAYSRMNLQSSFSQQVENLLSKNNLKPEEAIIVLGKELLFQFSRKLGIKAEISDETFFQWNLEYLSKLFFAEKHFEEESREALKLITKTTLQGDFEKIMLGQSFDSSRYSEEELETIKEIQEHNQKVKNEFEKAGLDYQFWLKDKTSKDFFVGASEKEKIQRLESFKRELSEVVLNILGSYREKKPGILSQERAKILFNSVFKKYGLKFENGEITHSKGKISPLDLQPILQETIDFLKSEFVTTKDERLGTNLDHLNNLLKILPDLQKESKQKSYHFQIKPWDRQPGYDIFQGNYTHCCIAVENFNRAAILDYLTDAGMNIIEIKDQNTGQTVAQTFVFMAQNEEGENIMVLDNVEINNDYRGLNQAIRQHLFEYISEYADKLVKDSRKKINTVLLGTAYNDIETSDLYQRKETVKKVGGAGIADTQYLDSFGSAWVDPSRLTNRTFYVALDDLREKIVEKPEIKKEQKIQIEILNRLNSEILRQIVSVEQASFPEQMQSDENDLRQTLENSKGVQIILRGANREIVGYLSSMPQKDAFEELKEYDKEMRPEDKALYVESIAIKPAARDVRSFLRLGKAFFQEAKRRGFKKITMHARIAENLSAVLQKRYGAKALRKIGNWHGFNEPFDYLEIEVE